jgi:hypothetical protein
MENKEEYKADFPSEIIKEGKVQVLVPNLAAYGGVPSDSLLLSRLDFSAGYTKIAHWLFSGSSWFCWRLHLQLVRLLCGVIPKKGKRVFD